MHQTRSRQVPSAVDANSAPRDRFSNHGSSLFQALARGIIDWTRCFGVVSVTGWLRFILEQANMRRASRVA